MLLIGTGIERIPQTVANELMTGSPNTGVLKIMLPLKVLRGIGGNTATRP